MNAEPFRPFAVRTSDGRQYRVRYPDFIAISPGGEHVTLYADEETSTILSTTNIVDLEVQSTRRRPR